MEFSMSGQTPPLPQLWKKNIFSRAIFSKCSELLDTARIFEQNIFSQRFDDTTMKTKQANTVKTLK